MNLQTCPYCAAKMEADFVDVGVGEVQCGPYHCFSCGASEIGPESDAWYYRNRDGSYLQIAGKRRYCEPLKRKVKWGKRVLRFDAPVTNAEWEAGFYQGRISPYANTVGGQLVDHQTAKAAYDLGMLDEKEW